MATNFLMQVSTHYTKSDFRVHPDLQKMISKYKKVFEQPIQLPPQCEFNHPIPLQDGCELVSIRPYCYPFFLLKDRAQANGEGNIINRSDPTSHGLFYFLVLLVKKTYASYRFYMDYWALNEIIIKDKFLMLIIDELLDELYESIYYSKLDLCSGCH